MKWDTEIVNWTVQSSDCLSFVDYSCQVSNQVLDTKVGTIIRLGVFTQNPETKMHNGNFFKQEKQQFCLYWSNISLTKLVTLHNYNCRTHSLLAFRVFLYHAIILFRV